MFDFTTYIQHLTETNKHAKSNNFGFGTCSGIGDLAGAVTKMEDFPAFVILDDVSSGKNRLKGSADFNFYAV